MRLTRSLASGLTRAAGDDPGVFWGVGDRGANISPADGASRFGIAGLHDLAGIDGAKVMPWLAVGPALARLRLQGNRIELEALHDLADSTGTPIGGLPVAGAAHAEHEPVFDLAGRPLGPSPGGADSEGIAALPDGTFWIAEEYGPSLLRVSRTGTVIERWVPRGMAQLFAGAGYPVRAVLPAIAAARKLNRGFEGIAASVDGSVLYVALQSPLAHPDRAAHRRSDLVRIWELDAADGTLLGEHVYPLDPPESFRRDVAAGAVRTDDVKVAELQLDSAGGLLVMERVTQTTKIYRTRLSPGNRAPAALSDPDTRPTLEQRTRADLVATRVPLLEKTLILSSDDHPELCADLEGMVLLGERQLLLANDSDYGVEGAETQFFLAEW
ncbi:MAG: esterase-like activity of phytase family protein [Novosphingobium sp.]|uniref:esterase-like activity of phytase family protein n=1 Tax=Novosphingobium sp. TaxID=1874826 RepID=UPI003C7D0F11